MWKFAILIIVVAGAFWGRTTVYQWHQSLSKDLLNEFAAWASIYGLLISCAGLAAASYAAWGIRQIKIRFLAKARLPALNKKLQKDASELSDLAEAFPVPQQQKTVLFSSLQANLHAVKRHLPRNLKRTQKDAMRLFDKLSGEAGETTMPAQALGRLESFWATYEKIQLLKNGIDNHLADEKWEN